MPRRRSDDDEDRGPDTPQLSGSYAFFAAEARRVEGILRRVILLYEKRIDLRDPERLEMLRELVGTMRVLGDAFEEWPKLSPERLRWEREHRVRELKLALRTAAEIVEEIPTNGALGKVRFPR